MRALKSFLLAMTAFVCFVSCNKELSLELGLATGSLKQDGTGVCLPSSVNGTYKVDTVLNGTNYIEVQVDIAETGTFIIKSDTINGYSFTGSGLTEVAGLNTVRLMASGKPVAPGINTFTINFGTTVCQIDVPVVTVGPPAAYTLGGTGSNCTGVSANGTYTTSLPMSPLNTVTLDVNVTTIGSYSLSTPVVNGISFAASGDFTGTGPQTVTLNAIGTPVAAGNFNFALTGNSGSCTFPITVTAAGSAAVYTLGGAGSSCTGFALAGTYTANTALTAANTVTIDVNVTTIGTYTISTTLANGVTFSKIGTFTGTGPQPVTLTGSGIPTASGVINHTVNGAVGSCTFSVTYGGGSTQAAYTLTGAGGTCTGATISGIYNVGTALTASNTATVQVNVTTLGTYNITTNNIGGMTFAKSGSFTALGPQSVILAGTGTPTTGSTNVFTVAGASSCTFDVIVDFISCKINGVDFTFNNTTTAQYPFPNAIEIDGFAGATSSEEMYLAIDRSIVTGGTITTGTYTNAASGTNYDLYADYVDPATIEWFPDLTDPFTITITTLTATRVTGTFSGTVREGGSGTVPKVITNGAFSVTIQ
jgi:hypothetical protein